jgi:murein L,D-transpeptidase YafK
VLTALAASVQQVSAQRAFVLNAVPSLRDVLTRPVPPALVDRDYLRVQLRHPRVVDAWASKRFEVMDMFEARGVSYPAAEIFLRVFKQERMIELWGRAANQRTFTLVKSYPICALSDVGPKRRQGDGQTPEGFYYVDFLNPDSDYHLSLHVNYPNAADRLVGRSGALGGDIFIHGGCLTEGCIAVTDEAIKELYWLAVEARSVGQRHIPVHIFPARLSREPDERFARAYSVDSAVVDFWKQLKRGYDHFEQTRTLPEIRVSTAGRYLMPDDTDPVAAPLETGPSVLGEPIATSAPVPAPATRAPAPAQSEPLVLGTPLPAVEPAAPDTASARGGGDPPR